MLEFLFLTNLLLLFFFKQKTAYEMRISDWSSDVCSSDLRGHGSREYGRHPGGGARGQQYLALAAGNLQHLADQGTQRAARGDNRPFRAKRPARPDDDG